MHIVVLVSLVALGVSGQQEDDWIDPYDMLNYDASTKSMRKPAEPSNYDNVPTKRREYTENSEQLSTCNKHLELLQRQNEDQQKKITSLAQQPTCNPVFKRFLSRLLKEIERVGLPSDSTESLFDAKVRVSKQTMLEIKSLLDGEESWRTGALDNAISQIITELRPHNYEAWVWHFEDTFGVEMDTLIKIALFVLVVVAIICTELWSTVSWFVQFKRLFAVCFMISIIWNWFYLYKIAFAEHQNNLVKMDGVNQKCTGVKKIDWSDSLKEWFRSTWTLQDDPCKRYYEVLMVNPILLVPPTKAISVTITTFITEPLKHFGQGISEFLRALLKDLPVQLQIPVLLTIVLSILVMMYGGVNAAFQHGIMAPFRRRRRDPPDQLEPPQDRYVPQIEGGGDAPFYAPLPQHQGNGNRDGNQIRQRPVNRGQVQRQRITIQNLGNMDHNTEDVDGEQHQSHSDSEQAANQSTVECEAEGNASMAEGNVSMPQVEETKIPAKTEETLNKKLPDDSRETAKAKATPNAAAEEMSSMPEPPLMGEVVVQNVTAVDTSPDMNLQPVRRNDSVGHPVQETMPEAVQ